VQLLPARLGLALASRYGFVALIRSRGFAPVGASLSEAACTPWGRMDQCSLRAAGWLAGIALQQDASFRQTRYILTSGTRFRNTKHDRLVTRAGGCVAQESGQKWQHPAHVLLPC
jgi:hypothetical protein